MFATHAHPSELRAIEAKEPAAVMSLLSIKTGSWEGPLPPSPTPMTTATTATTPEPASSTESDDEWLPPMPAKKRVRRKYVTKGRAASPAALVTDASDTDATATDAEDGELPANGTLYVPGDEEGGINPTHNILRRDILELFVEGKDGGKAHNAGYVGLRCRFCKDAPDQAKSPMSTVYPQTLEGMYRAVSVRFQKRHLPFCRYIPQEVQDDLDAVQGAKSRGNKGRWVDSALAKGLRNSADGKGIVFCPEVEG